MTSISVIITCYNEGELIFAALNSLYIQTDREFKIILVNGCSPDETTNRVCREIESSKKAMVIWNEKNLGLGFSRNTAFENLTSDVAVFLDADDTLPSDAISNIRKTFDQNPEADFIFGNYTLNYSENHHTETIDCSKLTDVTGYLSPNKLASDWKLLGTSPCKKQLWEKLGGYDLEFSNTTNDVDFWQRAILNGAKGKYCNNKIYIWNKSIHGQNSKNEFLSALWECNYKNIDFIIMYSNFYLDGLTIALRNNNYKKVKEWARYCYIKRKINTFLVTVFFLCPAFLLPVLCFLYRIRHKIAN